jgi:hypothetical protein
MIKLLGFLLLVIVLATAVVPLALRRSWETNFAELEVAMHKLAATLLFLLVLLTIPACSTTRVQEPPPPEVVLIPPAPTTVSIPAETLRPCLPLPKLEERVYTEVEVLEYMRGPAVVHADCRKRQADATKALRKAFNLN